MNIVGTIADTLVALEATMKAEAELRRELKRLRAVLELAGRGQPDPSLEELEVALREAQLSLRVGATDTALAIIDDALMRG